MLVRIRNRSLSEHKVEGDIGIVCRDIEQRFMGFAISDKRHISANPKNAPRFLVLQCMATIYRNNVPVGGVPLHRFSITHRSILSSRGR